MNDHRTPVTLPDFFIIGVPKAGTTALHVALARHPQLFLSRVKEPKFFLCDGPPPRGGGPGDAKSLRERIWRREDYEALFADAPAGALRGESTPFYLHDPAAHRRIRDAVPHAKLIALLRDPIDRAHSNWAHLWSAGLEPQSDFVAACRLEQQRAEAGWAQFWRYLELGRYGEQLQRLYDVFPQDQVLVLRYRDLRTAPAESLERICRFLGVTPGLVTEITAANVTTHASDSFRNRLLATLVRVGANAHGVLHGSWWPRVEPALSRHLQKEQRLRQPLTEEQRAQLLPAFVDDIRVLEDVTGDSFSDWLAPRSTDSPALRLTGKIGTAFSSIDRPLD
jgi:Sulfotransferase family